MSTKTATLKVEMNKSNTNPFYGMRNCLLLFQNASKGTVSDSMLNAAYAECKTKEQKEMFYTLLFSIGDITARQHNIFKKQKVDSGGNSQRSAFMTIISWMKRTNYDQFKKFLFARLFNEFSSFDSILANRVSTKKKTKSVTGVISSLSGSSVYLDDLAQFISDVIKGNNPADKYFVAKFLTRPRMSKRKGHKQMLPQTKEIMMQRQNFIKLVSDKAGFDYVAKKGYIDFSGYNEWRKEYNGSLESVLFSTKKILDFDKDQFINWLEKLPSGARYRVRRRLLDENDKVKASIWNNMGSWFLEWEKYKESKQSEVRVLEEKLRQNTPSTTAERVEMEEKLKTIKKEAKVTVGAIDFQSMFSEIVTGKIDKIKIQPFLDKINLPYNSLVFVDDSGSMSSYRENGFSAFDFATFLATIMLTKNPDDDARSLMGFFSASCRMYTSVESRSTSVNSVLRSSAKKVNEPLIKGEDHFLDNLKRIKEFAKSIQTSSDTNISSIPDHLNSWVNGDDTKIEILQNFPVWTIITDGNFNQMYSAESSMNDFMKRCENYFGYRPYIIAIDAANSSSATVDRFQGIDNMMYLPPNPAQIEQLLLNFKDLDVMDIYTPLQSLQRSNRYDVVRRNVL